MKHLVAFAMLTVACALALPAGAAQQHAKRHVTKHTTTVHRHVRKTVKKTTTRSTTKATGSRAGTANTTKPSPDKPSTDTRSAITRPGDYRFALQHEGHTRTYRVHVPQGYAATQPAPLVVALRPGGAGSPGGVDPYGLARESDRQGFIVVFPDPLRPTAQATPVAWNAGNCCGAGGANDVGFIETVVNTVFGQLSISRLHIYAAGMSDGGMMAYRLACELPHVFTAVASVAGTDNTAACTPDKPVSILHLHAKDDRRVPFAGGTDPLAKAKMHLASVPQTAAKWAKLDGCGEAPQTVLQTAGASCEAYTYCRGRSEVRMCTTDTGGHSWPGALKVRGQDTPSQALSATHTIWSFFSAH